MSAAQSGAGEKLVYCTFCKIAMRPQEAHQMHVRGRPVFIACDKHAEKVQDAVRTGAVFLRGAAVAGAKAALDKKAPGLFEAATKAIATYRELTTPEKKTAKK